MKRVNIATPTWWEDWYSTILRRDFATFETLVERDGPHFISRAVVRKNERFFSTLKRRRNVIIVKSDDGVAWKVEASEP